MIGLEFDDAGMPSGPTAGPFFDWLLRELAAQADDSGWDAPPRLVGLSSPVVAQAELALEGLGFEDFAPDASMQATGFVVQQLGVLPSPPEPALWGVDVPDGYWATVLIVEGWAYPPNVDEIGQLLPPSQHPDRQEVRALLAATRSGMVRVAVYRRTRGGSLLDPQMSEMWRHAAGGRILSLMGRSLGATVRPEPGRPPLPLRQFLGLALVAGVAAQPEVPAPMLEGCSGDEVLAVRRVFALAGGLVFATRLCGEFTGDDWSGAPAHVQAALAGLASGSVSAVLGDTGPGTLLVPDLVDYLALRTSDATWTGTLVSGRARPLLPEILPAGTADALWMGEECLEAWAGAGCQSTVQDAARTLTDLDADRGTGDTVFELLAGLGWTFPGYRPTGGAFDEFDDDAPADFL